MSKYACKCIRLKCYWESTIPLTSFEPQGKYISHVLWINNMKKGLFNGSLFCGDKCGLNTEASNVGRKKKKKDFDVCSWPRDYICPWSDVLHGLGDIRLLAGCWLLFTDAHGRETVWPEARCTSAFLWCCALADSYVGSGVSCAKQS